MPDAYWHCMLLNLISHWLEPFCHWFYEQFLGFVGVEPALNILLQDRSYVGELLYLPVAPFVKRGKSHVAEHRFNKRIHHILIESVDSLRHYLLYGA